MEIGLNFAILIIFRIATNDNEAIISLFTSFFNILSYEIRTGAKVTIKDKFWLRS